MLILHRMEVTQLNLRHLRAMSAIARLGSMTAAAQAISITQPAITQALAKLESQLDHQLFERRPDGMTNLPAATIFAPRVESALRHIGSQRVTMASLRAMIALADAGSYVEASDVTGLAEPSLHRAVRDLSLVLKRKLVERRGKGIALTDHGLKTARGFRLARAELESGLSELAALSGRETGRIAVGAMPLCRARLLPTTVSAFHKKHPDSQTAIVEGSFRELIEPLRDGQIDVMIGALRPTAPADDVVQSELLVDRLVVLGRKGHPLERKGGKVSAEDLVGFPWTISAPGTPLRIQWELLFASVGVEVPKVPVESGSVIANREILRKSDFLTLLSPDQVAVELESGWLTKICEAPGDLSRTIGITTRTGWRPTAMQSTFLKILHESANSISISQN
ncbi:MAG: LysR substrate-binding domain-containing protein [Woeseiaceae bacterium]